MCLCCGSQAAVPGSSTIRNSTKASGLVVRTWNDAPISRRDSDGYADATAMCQANGKRWHNYERLDTSTDYLQALSDSLGLPTTELVRTTTSGPNHLRGTWVHPRLAVDLARWLSPQFAVWMDGWFLEQLQQPAAPLRHVAAPRRRSLPSARPHRQHWINYDSLWPSERAIIHYIDFLHHHQGELCRTGDLCTALEHEWMPGTIRNSVTGLRNQGWVAKTATGWRSGWHLTQEGYQALQQAYIANGDQPIEPVIPPSVSAALAK